jgi:hypothetical protein
MEVRLNRRLSLSYIVHALLIFSLKVNGKVPPAGVQGVGGLGVGAAGAGVAGVAVIGT